jgi:hypothetical protein
MKWNKAERKDDVRVCVQIYRQCRWGAIWQRCCCRTCLERLNEWNPVRLIWLSWDHILYIPQVGCRVADAGLL